MDPEETTSFETGAAALEASVLSGERTSFAVLVRPATSRNIPVIPIPFMEKGPKLLNWPNLASCDPKQIAAWDRQFPGDMNYGCVAKFNGDFWFLDDDSGTLKERYEKETGKKFPITFTTKTRKGYHYYFKATKYSKATMGNRKVPDLFDVQAEDRQVVGPGSTHPSGCKYKVFLDAPIIAAPDALVDWIVETHDAYRANKGFSEPRQIAETEGLCEPWMLEEMCDELEIEYDAFSDYELDIVCPWEDDHSESHIRDTTIAIIKGQPTFSCLHAHCEGRHWKEFRDAVDPDRKYHFPIESDFEGFEVEELTDEEPADDIRVAIGSPDAAAAFLNQPAPSAALEQMAREADPEGNLRGKACPICKTHMVTGSLDRMCRECDKKMRSMLGESTPATQPADSAGCESPDSEEQEGGQYDTLASGKNAKGMTMSLDVQWADTVETEPLQWLWPDRLPKGKMALFAGRPDCGKSLAMIDLIARTTTGQDWPDGSKNPLGPQKVILGSSEDDPRDTLVPRLHAAGADLSKVGLIAVGRIVKGSKKRRMLKLKEDAGLLKRTLEQHPDVALVCLDPISSFFGDADANKDKEIKPVLDGLANVLRKTGATFIAISHLNKRPDGDAGQKILGASSVLGSARAVWFFSRDTENTSEFYMALVKGNLAKKRTGMKYSIAEEKITLKDGSQAGLPRIEWLDEHDETADELLARQKDEGRSGMVDKKITKATFFLQKKFAQASTFKCSDLYKEGEGEGLGVDTLKRARREMEKAGETVIYVDDRRSEGKGYWWTRQPKGEPKIMAPAVEEPM